MTRVREAFARLNSQQKMLLAVALAAIVALLVGTYLWSRQPDYRVLFANISEKDGGAIIAALDQSAVPYKYSEGGTAILVPADKVHDVRLKLASQGLPRGGSVGFELMENQKFGTSQFIEQVNFQRALEGELSRTIQSISAVQSARVHLAIPKPSVFVREEQKPTASVLLHLFPGRTLEPAQVAGITHLVASSVPQLPLSNVNIVDQNGNLLSQLKDKLTEAGLDPTQIKYVREVENSIIKRIEDILSPVLGSNNFRVQVAADLDFSHTEQTAETFRPNGTPPEVSIRSQQVSESANLNQSPGGGIPGALSNQPPVPATAPLTQPAVGQPGAAPGATPLPQNPNDRGQINAAGITSPMSPVAPPLSTRKDTTTNYEVDKTIRYTKQSVGSIRRLTAAVVVNHRMEKDKSGKEVPKPLSDSQIQQLNDLVREAMGYNQARGDSISVVNAAFTPEEKPAVVEPPFWKDPENISFAKEIFKYLLIAGLIAYLLLGVIRPIIRTMFPPPAPEESPEEAALRAAGAVEIGEAGEEATEAEIDHFAEKIRKAKEIAQNDPKAVANIIKDWLGVNGS
ncbi:flagellar basal-body MS-ring/collar protein FliF [Azovibrio restrictus]|uniref:flagellar basal-body MS-ring/collar protein FliF n=1 Tax=Azovibrio restrictus TaxID=146938 RepID=UPI0026F37064|nr:flagellar basal-body MS-ring/collar protein FliF [Azovibrio restrictus]